jgi:hypothetical protein
MALALMNNIFFKNDNKKLACLKNLQAIHWAKIK